jgi:Rad3-related DNA helicase
MNAAALAQQAGIQLRHEQFGFLTQVAEAIESDLTIFAEAATGVGKTIGYLAPALASGRKTVISTSTLHLQHQIMAEVERLGSRAARRVGMANFISPSRVNRILAGMQTDPHVDQEIVGQLRLMREHGGMIEAFVDEYGDLLVDRSLICLRSGCPKSDRADYDQQKDEAAGVQIVVQTHALTLLEVRFGRHDADITIFDEAHTIPSIAASAVEARVSLSEIGLEHLGERLGNRPMVVMDEDMRTEVQAAREAIEDADLRAEVDRILAPLKTIRHGVGLVAKPVPTLTRVAVDPARFLGYELDGTTSVFVSATLEPVGKFAASVGVHQPRHIRVDVARFGKMTIMLADRKTPVPFVGGIPDPDFFDYAADMVRNTSGRTLVLCASYDDVGRIAERVPGTIEHRRGDALTPLVERFRSQGGRLVTPAAWEGLDLPGLIDDIVVIRLPFSPRSELRESILEEILVARGHDPDAAKRILQRDARAAALRKLAQGIGRGIRKADDEVRLWIADPRFPLSAATVLDVKRMLAQGEATRFKDFSAALPERFRKGLASAYDHATIFPCRKQDKSQSIQGLG